MFIPPELRDLFSGKIIDLWTDGLRPEALSLLEPDGDAEDESGDAVAADAPAEAVRPDWPALQQPDAQGIPVEQEVPRQRQYLLKVRGRKPPRRSVPPRAGEGDGCVTRLKRALGALPGNAWACMMRATRPHTRPPPPRGRLWTNRHLIAAIEATEKRGSHERRLSLATFAAYLKRLEAGATRLDPVLVLRIARTFGLELDDLVFTYEASPGWSRGLDRAPGAQRRRRRRKLGRLPESAGPVAAFEAGREARWLDALRAYELEVVPLGDAESRTRLARDIVRPGTEVGPLDRRGDAAGAALTARQVEAALRGLEELLLDKGAPRRRLAGELEAVVGELQAAGLRVGVARHIGVVLRSNEPFYTPTAEPVRRVTVVVAPATEEMRVTVDLVPSWELRPTFREERLCDDGDFSYAREIRRDIAWAGHWEGRWFRFLPIDVPDWIMQAAGVRSLR